MTDTPATAFENVPEEANPERPKLKKPGADKLTPEQEEIARKVQPAPGRVLIQILAQEKSEGGIELPDAVVQRNRAQAYARVLKVGQPRHVEGFDGRIPGWCKVGDLVRLGEFGLRAAVEVTVDGTKVLIVADQDVAAKFAEE